MRTRVLTSKFSIKAIPQKKEGAAGQFRKGLGETDKGFKDTVLALQQIGYGYGVLFDRELKEQVNDLTVFVEEAVEPLPERL